jgi:hypothetical protein
MGYIPQAGFTSGRRAYGIGDGFPTIRSGWCARRSRERKAGKARILIPRVQEVHPNGRRARDFASADDVYELPPGRFLRWEMSRDPPNLRPRRRLKPGE